MLYLSTKKIISCIALKESNALDYLRNLDTPEI